MSNIRNAANRTLLLLFGAALLVGGFWLVTASSWVSERTGGGLPSWWPEAERDSVLLDRPGLGELRAHSWWTPVVIAGTAMLLLALLWWLFAEGRRGGLRVLPLSPPDVTLRTRAFSDALTQHVRALPSVAGAHVRVQAKSDQLQAHIHIQLGADARPQAVLRQLYEKPITEARAAAAPRPVTAHVRVSVRSHRAQRVK